jgi:GNAT superfamily N-acetyltransferase
MEAHLISNLIEGTAARRGSIGKTSQGFWVCEGSAFLQFADIEPRDSRLVQDVLPVLRDLRPHLTPGLLRDVYAEGYRQGLRFTAAYLDGKCVGVAGWRIVATTFCARKLIIDDLVVATGARSQGIGSALLTELEEHAQFTGCRMIELDSAVHRSEAHRFYTRERMTILAFHFGKQL